MRARLIRETSKSLLASLLAATVACFVLGCDGTGDAGGESRTISATGSSTIAPLLSEIGKRFEERNPGVRVDVQTGGSSRGISDVRSGLADIGMASRAMKPDESELHAYPIALDGVCVIVHADNPVESLTNEQLVDIYLGKIENWKDVGGADSPITVVNKAEGRSTLEIFTTYLGIEPREIEADVVIGDNEQGVKTVAGNPAAIGYVSIGTAQFDQEAGTPIKLLPAGGVAATVENVANGSFPISRPLHLVTKEEPSGAVKELIDFAQSAEVFDLVEELSFVPIR